MCRYRNKCRHGVGCFYQHLNEKDYTQASKEDQVIDTKEVDNLLANTEEV